MKYRSGGRTRKLIRPSLQLKLIGSFVGLTAVALFAQFLLLGQRLTNAAAELEGPGGELAGQIPGMLLSVLGISLVVMLPVITFLGVLLTLRVAGPVHRFEQFLTAVLDGEQEEPCSLRRGDELQELCGLINQATADMRAQQVSPEDEKGTRVWPLRATA